VFNQPHTPFVADFMEAGNFAHGIVAVAADGMLVDLAGARVIASPAPGTALVPGAAVTVTVPAREGTARASERRTEGRHRGKAAVGRAMRAAIRNRWNSSIGPKGRRS